MLPFGFGFGLLPEGLIVPRAPAEAERVKVCTAFTVSVALLLVAFPALLLITTLKTEPLSAVVVAGVV